MLNPWFKFYGAEYLSDPKIGTLLPVERSCWITLLCLASTSNIRGIIENLTIHFLLSQSGVFWDNEDDIEYETAMKVLETFKKLKMIRIDDTTKNIEIINWKKRQESSMTSTERSRKFRLKNNVKKQKETKRNERKRNGVVLEEKRIEENRREENINTNTAPPKVDAPFSLKEEIQKLYDNPRRDLNIIGLYFEERNPDIKTRDQFKIALKRHLKPAKDLSSFTDNQIIDAIAKAKKEYKDIYTLETIIKILTK